MWRDDGELYTDVRTHRTVEQRVHLQHLQLINSTSNSTSTSRKVSLLGQLSYRVKSVKPSSHGFFSAVRWAVFRAAVRRAPIDAETAVKLPPRRQSCGANMNERGAVFCGAEREAREQTDRADGLFTHFEMKVLFDD